MNRRTFLKGAALLAGASLWPASHAARAGSDGTDAEYGGPLLLVLHAIGAWDPTLFCDPKIPYAGQVINRAYRSEVGRRGAFAFAPVILSDYSGRPLLDLAQFFAELGPRMCVVNGLDTGTNNHIAAQQFVASGSMVETLPNVAALNAAHALQSATTMPCPYITDGIGYTSPLDAVTMSYPHARQLRALARPELYVAGQPDTEPLSAPLRAQVAAANAARTRELRGLGRLPREAWLYRAYEAADVDVARLRRLADALPAIPVTASSAFPTLVGYDPELDAELQKVEHVLTSFGASAAAGGAIAFGDFDTHRNHDYLHAVVLARMLLVFSYALRKAESMGLSNRLTVALVSDFGRTPWYNSDNGKDHWNATSAVVVGPGVEGGRVVGFTDEEQRPLPVDPKNPTRTSADGVVPTPAHLHAELRRVLGLANTDLDARYRVVPPGAPLRLLSS